MGRLELRIDPTRPLYMQIVEQIERGVLRGLLDAGERLPSVRQLSLALGVNPNTVARAYRELEAAGVIETRAGSGTFVADDVAGAHVRRRELAWEATAVWSKEMCDLGVSVDEALEMARRALLSPPGDSPPPTRPPAEQPVTLADRSGPTRSDGTAESKSGSEAPREGVQR